MAHPNDTIARLMAAEVDFLTAFGWVPFTLMLHNGTAHVQFRDPMTGDEMDQWVAVAKQKTRANFP